MNNIVSVLRIYKVFMFLIFTTTIAVAQLPSSIVWDMAVGCESKTDVYHFNVEEMQECIKTCQNSTVTYTLVGDSSPWIDVQWIVIGGSVQGSSNQDVVILWGGQSSGQIIIKIETREGIFTFTVCIELIAKPVVDFTVYPNGPRPNVIEVCKDETIYFENLSHANGGAQLIFHSWYFSDDMTTVAAFEPTHVFRDSGTHFVTLTVTNACNCTSSQTIEINVHETGLQIACNSIACGEEVVVYSVTNIEGEYIECERYEWLVEGGAVISENSREVTVQWNNIDDDGFGYITYTPIVCNVECVFPTTIKVPVIKNDIEIKGPARLCEGKQARFNIPQWSSTQVEWKITPATGMGLLPSDQPNEIVLSANVPGQYLLEAIYNNTLKGCEGVAFKKITIDPIIEIQGPKTACVYGSTANYTTSSGAVYDWIITGPSGTNHINGSTISTQFTMSGIYYIYIGQIECLKQSPFAVYVKSLPESPVGIDGPLEICFGVPILYTAVPSLPDHHQAIWNIAPGSGIFPSTMSDQMVGPEAEVIWNPNYTSPYQLRLVFEKDGCINPDVVVVHPVPLNLQYTLSGPQTVCSSTYGTYSVDYLEGDKYEWKITTPDLGSIAEYPQDHEVKVLWNNVTVPTTAILEVSIEKCGIKHIQHLPITIYPTATISINAPPTACRGEVVNFSLNGVTSWSEIIWDFGDGYLGHGPNPTHSYNQINPTATTYTVNVTVKKPNGCFLPTTASFDIEITPVPEVYLSSQNPLIICNSQNPPPTFPLLTVNTIPSPTMITSIDWIYNYNTPITLPPMTTTYLVPADGIYHVEVTFASGCTATSPEINVILKNCDPPLNCTGNEPSPIITAALTDCNTATATVTTSGSTPLSYAWYLNSILIPGQPQNSATFNPTLVGDNIIRYEVEYPGVDSNNDPCIYILEDVKTVFVPYKAYLNYTLTCNGSGNGYNLTLYDVSQIDPRAPSVTKNYFMDNVPLTQGTNLSQFTLNNVSSGSHTLTLEIGGYTTPGGVPITCTATVQITVPDMLTATIVAPTEACAGEPVQFYANVNASDLIYEWDFGDNAKNSLPDPIRNFDGSYSNLIVTLTVTNTDGCTFTTTHNITINNPDMEGLLALSPASTCYGNPITITYNPLGVILPSTYIWHQEVNGTIINTQQTTVNSINVYQPGVYVLDGMDNNGCIQYGIARISVSFLERPDTVIIAPSEVCTDQPFKLYAQPKYSNTYQYRWALNGQPLPQWDDEPEIEQTISIPGHYTYELTVTAPSQCSTSNSYDILVNPMPEVPEIWYEFASCDPYMVVLYADAQEPGSYVWSDGQSGDFIEVYHGGPYRVTFFNEHGCSSSAEIHVPHNPESYSWTYPQGCYELCESNYAHLYVTGPNVPFRWSWLLDSNVIQSGYSVMPDEYWMGDGHYQLFLESGECYTTSPGFSWTMSERCVNCDVFIRILGVYPRMDVHGNCYYVVDLNIFNSGAISYVLDNLTNTGVMIPGAGYLPGGSANTTFEFYPPDNFMGGNVDFNLMGSGNDVFPPYICSNFFSIVFPPCPPGSSRPAADTPTVKDAQSYTVAPNPTSGKVQLTYPTGNTAFTLHIYDLGGREIKKETLSNTGKITIDIAEFATGTYLLIVRDEKKTVFYERIILQR